MADKAQSLTQKPDKESVEPVNINDTFRKAKRNSLLWSTVAILAVVGEPVSRDGTASSTALVPIYPLGIGFPQWTLVIISLIIAIYMYVGFRRSLHTIDLMNSQRFRERGLEDVPAAMSDLIEEVEATRRGLDAAVQESHRVWNLQAQLEKHLENFKGNLEKVINAKIGVVANLLRDQSNFTLVRPRTPAHLVEEYESLVKKQNVAFDQLETSRGEILERIEHLSLVLGPKENPVTFKDFRNSLEELAKSAAELTQYHQAIDKTDQNYLQNFDVEPTAALFSIAIFLGFGWLAIAAFLPSFMR